MERIFIYRNCIVRGERFMAPGLIKPRSARERSNLLCSGKARPEREGDEAEIAKAQEPAAKKPAAKKKATANPTE